MIMFGIVACLRGLHEMWSATSWGERTVRPLPSIRMRALHGNWFYVAVISNGVVGLWGIALLVLKKKVDRSFNWATGVAVAAMLIQVGLGLLVYQQGHRPANDFHLFYGFVILFTFTFAYLYRAQMSKRPALSWGLLLLFVMGLGLRAWSNVN
jgi:hypothetical protein